MFPPGTLNCFARNRKSISSSLGTSAGKSPSHSLVRCSSSGNGNSTTKCMRRQKASSRLLRRLVARITMHLMLLHPLQEVAGFDIWHTGSWASLTSERLPRKARLPRRKTRWRCPTRLPGTSGPGFSPFSPIYLLTACDRSILYISTWSSAPMTSAAIVLPVPGGPVKRAEAFRLCRGTAGARIPYKVDDGLCRALMHSSQQPR